MHDAPEIENPILAITPFVPLHVTTEASMAVICNVDSSTCSLLTIVLFVSVAIAVILPLILLGIATPRVLATVN